MRIGLPTPPPAARNRQKRLKKNGNWSNAQLKSALADFDDGMSMRGVARENGIPPSTLRGHIYGTTLQRRRGKVGVLTDEEEKTLAQHLVDIQDLGFPLTIGQLREKVSILTQSRHTPFKNGVPGPGWVKCFKWRHPELSIRKAQSLEQKRAKNLCPAAVASFYENLQRLYEQNAYEAKQIWNCDESGVQGSKDGGGYVIALKGTKIVQKVTHNHKEWMSVLTCINVQGDFLPNFYIFKGKRKSKNFLIKTGERGATMAM